MWPTNQREREKNRIDTGEGLVLRCWLVRESLLTKLIRIGDKDCWQVVSVMLIIIPFVIKPETETIVRTDGL